MDFLDCVIARQYCVVYTHLISKSLSDNLVSLVPLVVHPSLLSMPLWYDFTIPQKKSPPEDLKELAGKDSGTIVVWKNLDKQLGEQATHIIEESKIWTGRTYRTFIKSGVNFTINGENVYSIDPLYIDTETTKFPNDPKAYEYKEIIIEDWPIDENLDSSKYDKGDKEYFKRFYKLYLGFFFILDMNKGEITKLSPFFQLPSKEAKQELIFFPTTICEDNKGFIDISYSLGDNRSYVCKLHSEVIKTSLYDKNNIDMHMNYNVNTNYYLELLRTLRIVNKFSPKPEDFNIFVEA